LRYYNLNTRRCALVFLAVLETNNGQKCNEGVKELPSSINTYLHTVLNLNNLDKTLSNPLLCTGRCYDENEEDERELEFQGYFTNVINVDSEIGYFSGQFAPIKYVSQRLTKALQMVADAHATQRRKSDNSPYINHLVHVQYLLANIAKVSDEDIVIAGVLHDIIEDTKIEMKTIVKNFGSRVAKLVMALTDDKTVPLEQRRLTTLKKLDEAPQSAKIIKLADVCSNVETIPPQWDAERISRYIEWLDAVVEKCEDASLILTEHYKTVRNSKL
jgi:guanosine-3',5'-bis(diphosphate) 3'-pyrophosphohydrolase